MYCPRANRKGSERRRKPVQGQETICPDKTEILLLSKRKKVDKFIKPVLLNRVKILPCH
jgi:hypothetical protein